MDINKLKAIGQLQATYMWHVTIPVIPFVGINNLEFQIRTTTIPGKTRSKNVIRYLGQQYTLPGAVEWDGEWSATIIMSEIHEVFDKMILWNNAIDRVGGVAIESIKTSAYIRLLGLNKTVINKRFILTGLYPLSYPEIGDLDQSGVDGHITFDQVLAYDDIDFDPNNVLSF